MRVSIMEKIYQLCDIILNASYIKFVYLHILLFTRTYLEKISFLNNLRISTTTIKFTARQTFYPFAKVIIFGKFKVSLGLDKARATSYRTTKTLNVFPAGPFSQYW